MIYRVEHPESGFHGVMMGVDFHDGRGSTSSAHDVVKLVALGCRLPDPAARAEIRTLAQQLARQRRKWLADYSKMREFEASPAYTESALRRKAEREEAEAERKKANRPRRRHR